jgi:5-hydroxyisourate hydrolase-like protein (transthyretin family)
VEIDLPAMQFVLHQNYPNPFNPTTKINYSLPIKTTVSLIITDLLGREILKLVNNENQEPGNYEVEFNGTEFSSGVYFYTLITETFYQSNKMID